MTNTQAAQYAQYVKFHYEDEDRVAMLRCGKLYRVTPPVSNKSFDDLTDSLKTAPDMFAPAKQTHQLENPLPDVVPFTVLMFQINGQTHHAAESLGILLNTTVPDMDRTVLNKIQAYYDQHPAFFSARKINVTPLKAYEDVTLTAMRNTDGTTSKFDLLMYGNLVVAAHEIKKDRAVFLDTAAVQYKLSQDSRLEALKSMTPVTDPQTLRDMFPEVCRDDYMTGKGAI